MTEEIIKVERCAFIGSDGHCLSPINGSNKYCDKVPEKWCYYKQLQRLKQENEELKCLLVDISDMATVNAITTCWAVMDNCNKCSDVKECGTQSPLMKLQIIRKKINEVLK